MTRLRTWLTAAAVAVTAAAGALTFPDALEQQAQLIVPEMTCDEWQRIIAQRDTRRRTFWVAMTHAVVQAGTSDTDTSGSIASPDTVTIGANYAAGGQPDAIIHRIPIYDVEGVE